MAARQKRGRPGEEPQPARRQGSVDAKRSRIASTASGNVVAEATRTLLGRGVKAAALHQLLRQLGMKDTTGKAAAPVTSIVAGVHAKVLAISDADARRSAAELLARSLSSVFAATSPARELLRDAVKESGRIINTIKASTEKRARLKGLLDLCTQQFHILTCVNELRASPINPTTVGADTLSEVSAGLRILQRRAAAFDGNLRELVAQQRSTEATLDAVLAASPVGSPVAAAPASVAAWRVGAAVTAPWGGKAALFPGKIAALHGSNDAFGTVDIRFDDGDFERNIPRSRCLLLHVASQPVRAPDAAAERRSALAMMDMLEKATPGSELAGHIETRRLVRAKISSAKQAQASTLEEIVASTQILALVTAAIKFQSTRLAFSKASIVQHDESVVKNIKAATGQMTTCIAQLSSTESKRQAKFDADLRTIAEDLAGYSNIYTDDSARGTLLRRKDEVSGALAKSQAVLAETVVTLQAWSARTLESIRAVPRGTPMRNNIARTFATAAKGQRVPEPFTALLRQFFGECGRLLPAPAVGRARPSPAARAAVAAPRGPAAAPVPRARKPIRAKHPARAKPAPPPPRSRATGMRAVAAVPRRAPAQRSSASAMPARAPARTPVRPAAARASSIPPPSAPPAQLAPGGMDSDSSEDEGDNGSSCVVM